MSIHPARTLSGTAALSGSSADRSLGADPLALRRAIARLRQEGEAAWTWETDATGRYVGLSRSCRDGLGYAPGELIGRTPFDLMPLDEATRIERMIRRLAAGRQPVPELLHRSIHRDGRIVVLEIGGTPVLDATGALLGYRGTARDVTGSETAAAHRHRADRYDFLTGLPNRACLRAHLSERLREGPGAPHVLAIDLERFRAIEAQFGHAGGDAVLCAVAERLAGFARAHRALAGRLAGDEFVLITADGLDPAGARALAEVLRTCLDADIRIAASRVQVGAGIGLAQGGPGTSPDALLAAAEADRFRARIATTAVA